MRRTLLDAFRHQGEHNLYSLDTANEEDKDPLIELLPDVETSVEQEAMSSLLKQDLVQVVKQAMEVLSESELEVILLRFGFASGSTMTHSEVGYRRGVSKKRIHQIEKAALEKLRSEDARALELRCYLDFSCEGHWPKPNGRNEIGKW